MSDDSQPSSPEYAAHVAAWRADLVANGITPPDGATDSERATIAAVNARKVTAGR